VVLSVHVCKNANKTQLRPNMNTFPLKKQKNANKAQMGTNLHLGGRWPKPPCLSIKVWHHEDISWAQNQNSSIKLKNVIKDKKNTLLNIGIMGGRDSPIN
jgi:hypothetical protein